MNCADFDRWWQRRFDLDATSGSFDHNIEWDAVPPGHRRHLESCERCQMLLESGRLLAESISAWRASPPQVELPSAQLTDLILADQILADCRRQSAPRRTRVSLPPGPTTATTPVSSCQGGDRREVWIRRACGLASACAAAVGVWFFSDRFHPLRVDPAPTAAAAIGTIPPVDSRPSSPRLPAQTTVADLGDAREHSLPQLHLSGDRPIAEAAAEAIQDVAALVDPNGTAFERTALDRAGPNRDDAPTRRLSPGGLSRLGLVAVAESRVFERLEVEISPIGREVGKTLGFLRIVGQAPVDSRHPVEDR